MAEQQPVTNLENPPEQNKPDNVSKWYFGVLGIAVLFYLISCAPGALWQDSGMFQYRIWNNDINGGLGLALAHPLYHLIGILVKQLPFGEFGYRINLISAVFAAFTVANVFLLLRLWLGRNLPAVIGAITLAVSWTFWQHACIAEVYSLYTALFTAELVLLLQYLKRKQIGYLYLLWLFNGLAISNHMWGVIPLACYAFLLTETLVKGQISFKNVLIVIVFWVIGAFPYEFLIVKELIHTGDLAATLRSAFFGNTWDSKVLNTSITFRVALENIIFIGYNFATLNILFLFAGVSRLYKVAKTKKFNHIMLVLLIMFFVFAFRYPVPDRYAFFLPFYCLVSCFIGVGICEFLRYNTKKIFVILIFLFSFSTVAVYGIVPQLAERFEINLGTKRNIPYRNEYIYFLRPWQTGNNAPQLFATDVLNSVEEDAVLMADGTTVYALWYIQEINRVKRGVKVISEHGDYQNPIEFPTEENFGNLLAGKNVYVVSPVAGYCSSFVLKKYDFVKAGIIYRVIEKGVN